MAVNLANTLFFRLMDQDRQRAAMEHENAQQQAELGMRANTQLTARRDAQEQEKEQSAQAFGEEAAQLGNTAPSFSDPRMNIAAQHGTNVGGIHLRDALLARQLKYDAMQAELLRFLTGEKGKDTRSQNAIDAANTRADKTDKRARELEADMQMHADARNANNNATTRFVFTNREADALGKDLSNLASTDADYAALKELADSPAPVPGTGLEGHIVAAAADNSSPLKQVVAQAILPKNAKPALEARSHAQNILNQIMHDNSGTATTFQEEIRNNVAALIGPGTSDEMFRIGAKRLANIRERYIAAKRAAASQQAVNIYDARTGALGAPSAQGAATYNPLTDDEE